MKTLFLAASVATLAAASGVARAEVPQVTDQPAGAPAAAPLSVEQELAQLRDLVTAQTLRLDEAEQALKKQNEVIADQQAKIAALEQTIGASTRLAALSSKSATVRRGDTLSAVARRMGVDFRALAAANNLRAPYRIMPGQRLSAPGATPAVTRVAAAETPAPAPSKSTNVGGTPPAPQAQPTQVAAVQSGGATPGERPDVTQRAVEQQRREQPAQTATPNEVGVRPENENQRPTVAVLPDVGGILTPKGTLYIEPSFDYAVTADNRFFFDGQVIFDVIQIGALAATNSDRRAKTASLGFRYGITKRLEVDGRVPLVDRVDRVRDATVDEGSAAFSTIEGSGLGDAEIGLHYQVNDGRNWPYAIVNFRAKAPTGDGPFDVARDSKGVETELSTGSGYWTLEPSVTFILPSDPAVIFGNIGYQLNLKQSLDVPVGTTRILEFDPGEAIRASVGIGLSVNEKMSISFGYDQTNFFKTKTLVERPLNSIRVLDSLAQPSSVIGSFLFGASYRVNKRLNINLNTAIGATDAAPDVRASVRASYRLFD